MRIGSCEGISVAKINVLYFLEDRAQEGFVKALVARVAGEVNIPGEELAHDVRSARHGSKVVKEFRQFLKYAPGMLFQGPILLVVAIDGNCSGYGEKVRQLENYVRPNHPFKGKVAYAIPDPHIERWYMMDQAAFKEGISLDKAPDMPPYKCHKNYYKLLLNATLKEGGINSVLGGAEYAERIVSRMRRLDALSQHDPGFGHFVADLRGKFRTIAREGTGH